MRTKPSTLLVCQSWIFYFLMKNRYFVKTKPQQYLLFYKREDWLRSDCTVPGWPKGRPENAKHHPSIIKFSRDRSLWSRKISNECLPVLTRTDRLQSKGFQHGHFLTRTFHVLDQLKDKEVFPAIISLSSSKKTGTSPRVIWSVNMMCLSYGKHWTVVSKYFCLVNILPLARDP